MRLATTFLTGERDEDTQWKIAKISEDLAITNQWKKRVGGEQEKIGARMLLRDRMNSGFKTLFDSARETLAHEFVIPEFVGFEIFDLLIGKTGEQKAG